MNYTVRLIVCQRLCLKHFILVSACYSCIVFAATSKRVRGEVKPTLRRRTSTHSRYSSTARRASTAHDVHMAMLPDLSGTSNMNHNPQSYDVMSQITFMYFVCVCKMSSLTYCWMKDCISIPRLWFSSWYHFLIVYFSPLCWLLNGYMYCLEWPFKFAVMTFPWYLFMFVYICLPKQSYEIHTVVAWKF